MLINNVRINIVNSTVIIKNISEFIYFVRVNFVKYRYGMVYTLYSTVERADVMEQGIQIACSNPARFNIIIIIFFFTKIVPDL